MNTIANLISPGERTCPQPALFLRRHGRANGEFKGAGEQHFQISNARRKNDDDDDLACECVIGPKTCLKNRLWPVADLFPHRERRLPGVAAIGSGGHRRAGLATCPPTGQLPITLASMEPFECSVGAGSSRRSS